MEYISLETVRRAVLAQQPWPISWSAHSIILWIFRVEQQSYIAQAFRYRGRYRVNVVNAQIARRLRQLARLGEIERDGTVLSLGISGRRVRCSDSGAA
jgi:hypothetical protein